MLVKSDKEKHGPRLTDADILATLDLGSVMARQMDGTIDYWSRGCERLYGYTAEEAVGQCAHSLLETVFPVPWTEIETSLLAQGEWRGDLRHRTRDGREVIVAAHKLLRNGHASPMTILETLTDVTAHRLAETELRRSRALLSSITETTSNFIYAKDRDGRIVLANAAVLAFLGRSRQEVEGLNDRQLLDDQTQADAIMEIDRSIMTTGRNHEIEERVDGADGRTHVLLSAKAPMRNHAGDVIGLVGISVDITERKRNEERLALLVHELNHRVKNTLATVQSIAFHTFHKTDHDRFDAFTERLQALTAVHDLLTRASWQGAAMNGIVECAIDLFRGIGNERFFIQGPELVVKPRAAVALSLGLHELLTNASKYGALSAPSGHVGIEWRVDRNAGCFEMRWREHGGPAVHEPLSRGFGTRVVERLIARDLGGTCDIVYDPAGVRCDITASVGEIARAPGEEMFPRVDSLAG